MIPSPLRTLTLCSKIVLKHRRLVSYNDALRKCGLVSLVWVKSSKVWLSTNFASQQDSRRKKKSCRSFFSMSSWRIWRSSILRRIQRYSKECAYHSVNFSNSFWILSSFWQPNPESSLRPAVESFEDVRKTWRFISVKIFMHLFFGLCCCFAEFERERYSFAVPTLAFMLRIKWLNLNYLAAHLSFS